MGQSFLTRIFSSADKTKLDAFDQGLATTDTPTFAGAEFTGSVGIGTGSPDAPLHIDHTSDQTMRFSRSGANTYRFEHDPSRFYIYNDTTAETPLLIQNDGSVIINAGDATFGGDVLPGTTEALDIGSASLEWDNIYLQNAATVSDERRKKDISTIKDASKFLREIDPVWFTYTEKVIPEETKEFERQVTKTVQRSQKTIEMRNGVATEVTTTVDVDEPQFTEVPVFDEGGNPVMETVLVGTREDGNPVMETRQKTHKEPIMETVSETIPEKVVSHGRPHTGFIAQKIKQAMTECGYADWAGYAYDDEEDLHMLRLMEMIAFTVKGWQELDARLTALEK